jgi:hypothetical protein
MEFIKTNNGYLAEHTASTSFNLHIEGGGRILIYRKTSGEKGSLIASIPAEVVDVDVVVNYECTYTIVLSDRADVVVITTAEGEVINAVIPEGDTPSGDAPKEITFTISDYQGEDRTFTALEGMTWEEFCESEYNTEGWYTDPTADNSIFLYTEGVGPWTTHYYYLYEVGVGMVTPEQTINPSASYTTFTDD